MIEVHECNLNKKDHSQMLPTECIKSVTFGQKKVFFFSIGGQPETKNEFG